MSNTRFAVLVIVGWLSMTVFTAGFLLANVQSIFDDDCALARKMYRTNLGIAFGVALLPPVWILTPFLTGFWEHGWKLSPPRCQKF